MNVPSQPTKETPAGSVGLILRGPDPGTVETQLAPYPAVEKSVLLPEFIAAVTAGSPSPVTEQEALDVLAICLSLDESAATGGRVDIEYQDLERSG